MIKKIYNFIYDFFLRNYNLRYKNKYAHAKKLFVMDVGLFAVTAILFISTIYIKFWNPGLTDQIDLAVNFDNVRIKSGELMKLSVDYKNRSKYDLKNSILAVHLPEGFLVDRTLTPKEIFHEDSTFDLGQIRSGAKGHFFIYGRAFIEPKNDTKITALLSYLPENSNNKEQKLSAAILNLPESLLTSDISMSTTSFAGNHVPFVYSLKNNSDTKLNNIKVDFSFPNEVKINKVSTTSLEQNESLMIEGEIIMPKKSDEYSLEAVANAEINGQTMRLLKTSKKIKTFSPEIGISAELNDSPKYAEPKQILSAHIVWKNFGKFVLNNQNIRLSFTPRIVDLSATAKINGLKTDGKDIIITPEQRTALANTAPQSSDELDIKIQLSPTFDLRSEENVTFKIIPHFIAEIKDLPGQTFDVFGSNAELPVATELNLFSEARYYSDEGDQLGRGPLPLTANETTKYWIFVRVQNTTNAVGDAVFSARLPANVEWVGQQSVTIGPAISFDEKSRILNWKFYNLPANSQTGLYFEVAITPTADQTKQPFTLLNDVKFSATDKTTGKQFNLIKNIVNNILPPNDPGSRR